MPDFACARPLVFRGSDGVNYEFGAGTIYPGLSQEFCDHWRVIDHSEAAVRQRGGALVAVRQFLALDTTTSNYVAINHWGPILLDPAINANYAQNLQLLDAPLFQSALDSFADLDRPPASPPFGSNQPAFGGAFPPALGFYATARAYGVPRHRDSYIVPTTKVFPGDGVSPPVGKVTDPDAGRARREQVEFDRQQAAQLRAVQGVSTRYIDVPNDPAVIPWPTPRPASDFVYLDPRAAA